MNQDAEHLTKEQLQAYRSDNLPLAERREISGHLLRCKTCLAALPAPTPQQFLAAVFRENTIDDATTILSTETKSFHNHFFKPSLLVLGGAMAVILLATTLLISFAAINLTSTEKELAESFEVTNSEIVPGEPETNSNQNLQNVKPDNLSVNSAAAKVSGNRNIRVSSGSQNQRNKSAAQSSLNSRTNNAPSISKPPAVALTRGAIEPCAVENAFETSFSKTENSIVLKWKPVPNAAKYQLYVSDDDEILIDEYETERETSYNLTKPLSLDKSYQWRIIATLRDGQRVVGDSRRFKLQDLQNKRNVEKKDKAAIRCLKNN